MPLKTKNLVPWGSMDNDPPAQPEGSTFEEYEERHDASGQAGMNVLAWPLARADQERENRSQEIRQQLAGERQRLAAESQRLAGISEHLNGTCISGPSCIGTWGQTPVLLPHPKAKYLQSVNGASM